VIICGNQVIRSWATFYLHVIAYRRRRVFWNNLHYLDSKATKWKAKPFKTLWANLCFFSDRRLIVFQKSHAFCFLLFLLNKRNAVENQNNVLLLLCN
jgi:hypothetical protein